MRRTQSSAVPVILLPGLGSVGAMTGPVGWVQRRLELITLGGNHRIEILDYSDLGVHQADVPTLAAACAVRIRQRHVGPVRLIGHSTGGSIALQLAATEPALVERLVLVASAHRLGQAGLMAQLAAARAIRAGRLRAAAYAIATGFTTHHLYRMLGLATVSLWPKLVLGSKPRALAPLLELERSFDALPLLGQVQARTLIIGGDHDGYYPVYLLQIAAAAIREAELLVLRGQGHLALLQPVVHRRVQAFLADL